MADAGASGAEVLCVGEVLWDSLPAGLFLGGAPLNVACHLRALGVPAAVVSRVGADRLGREAVRRMAGHRVATDLVQVDPRLPTGFVGVSLDAAGNAEYDIVAPAAWDAIESTDQLLARARRARALVFGTLAQRATATHTTVERLWDSGTLLVFDVNLRAPHYTPRSVERSLHRAGLVKLNDGELRRIAEWFGLPRETRAAAEALAERFGCGAVAVTRGACGAALWRDGAWTEHEGFAVEVADTVGAGDAFLAALLAALFEGAGDEAALRRANALGALVASRPGAVPAVEADALAELAARGAGRRAQATGV